MDKKKICINFLLIDECGKRREKLFSFVLKAIGSMEHTGFSYSYEKNNEGVVGGNLSLTRIKGESVFVYMNKDGSFLVMNRGEDEGYFHEVSSVIARLVPIWYNIERKHAYGLVFMSLASFTLFVLLIALTLVVGVRDAKGGVVIGSLSIASFMLFLYKYKKTKTINNPTVKI